MGLKAGWIALFLFVWIIGAFLGSTFEYQTSVNGAGIAYSTGTATFTHNSDELTSGGGATWSYTMDGGNIKCDADGTWYRLTNVGGGYISDQTGIMYNTLGGSLNETTPATIIVGANTVTVTTLGTFVITIPAGNTGTAASNVCTVQGSPVALVAGDNTITTTGVVGSITVTTVGTTQGFLHVPYNGTTAAGAAYTMAQSPGWAGSGSGGYATSPITKMEYLIDVNNAHQNLPLLGVFTWLVPNGEYFKTVRDVLLWKWSFMDGYEMIYWIFFMPFVAMGVLSVILLIYGVISGNITMG
jgi:hypothetical protein